MAALALLAAAARAQAPADCPPVPPLPTAQDLREGERLYARDRGFLWRLAKDGRQSYLYGTIHLGRFEWIFPGPAVSAALRETDTLALELDLAEPRILQRTREAMRAPASAATLAQSVAARLQRQIELACLPTAALAPLHPLAQAMTLAVLAGRRDGLDPAYGQEQMLAERARSAQRSVVSLETPERQVAALMPDEPQQVRVRLERLLSELEDGRARRQLQRLGEVWERGDLDRLEHFEQWCECAEDDDDRAFLRRVNDERNPGLAARIDALHREGRRVFAAVGALHLAGPNALPALLRARGYEVERIRFPR